MVPSHIKQSTATIVMMRAEQVQKKIRVDTLVATLPIPYVFHFYKILAFFVDEVVDS